ncbi:MAG: hypothetical protein RL007_1191 [Bacteroidota bacterium]|jgi:hypothetical protein
MSIRIQLSYQNPRRRIPINHENDFVQIDHIKVCSVNRDNLNKTITTLEDSRVSLILEGTFNVETKRIRVFDGIFSAKKDFLNNPILELDNRIEGVQHFDYLTLELSGILPQQMSDSDLVIEVALFTSELSISIEDPFKDFQKHMEPNQNVKVLFSAPFGQGKTTFINHYFEQYGQFYNTFRLFPVNYSVSSNEDIFKYIKANILVEIFEKPYKFDKAEFAYTLTAPEFFKANAIEVLSPLVQLLPNIGKSVYEVIKPLKEIAEKYFEFHDEVQIDNEGMAKSFVKRLCETEGSIYEDNFYTQLIRQQLEHLKESTKKKNVLIIDDLDRIDPDHIFRILNVFAAHFDQPEYKSSYSNKFGFDKIILVGDYYNIKHIYHYRYGPNVHFDGYIKKYFSTAPFYYDNVKALKTVLPRIKENCSLKFEHQGWELFECVVSHLIEAQFITLRDALKLEKQPVIEFIENKIPNSSFKRESNLQNQLGVSLVMLLLTIIEAKSLKDYFEKVAQLSEISSKYNYDLLIRLVLPFIADPSDKSRGHGKLIFDNREIHFAFDLESNNRYNYQYYFAGGEINEHHKVAQVFPWNGTMRQFFLSLSMCIDKMEKLNAIR